MPHSPNPRAGVHTTTKKATKDRTKETTAMPCSPNPRARAHTATKKARTQDRTKETTVMDWSELPAGLVGLVATCGRLSLGDVCRMRCACRAWKAALPEMGGPWLVLSPAAVSEQCVSFWSISPDSGVLTEVPAWSPPLLTSCWGSCDGVLALKTHGDGLFLYHPLGRRRRDLHPLPHGKKPQRLILSEVDDWGVMCCAVFSPESRLYVAAGEEEDGEIGAVDAEGWIEQARFSDGVRSIEFGNQFNIHVADNKNKVEIDVFQGDVATAVVDLEDMEPWPDNGHHLFLLNGEVYMCVIGQRKDNGQAVVRLFAVVQGQDFQLEPRDTIHQNSLFLGQNRSIVLPSQAGPIGMRPNTVYIQDNSGRRILMINIATQEVEAIPLPPHVAAATEFYGPASWICVWDMP